MKSLFVLIATYTLFALISCGPAPQDAEQTQQLPATPQTEQQSSPASGELPQSDKAATGEQPSTTPGTAEVMLNPAHGQPNHRCDIPVGAPLNSPPAKTTQGTTNSQNQPTAPKNSTTSQKLTNNTTSPTVDNLQQTNSPQTGSKPATPKSPKPRLNPAHGQDWHRCDIEVGSPLP